jgi:hypothetical protein
MSGAIGASIFITRSSAGCRNFRRQAWGLAFEGKRAQLVRAVGVAPLTDEGVTAQPCLDADLVALAGAEVDFDQAQRKCRPARLRRGVMAVRRLLVPGAHRRFFHRSLDDECLQDLVVTDGFDGVPGREATFLFESAPSCPTPGGCARCRIPVWDGRTRRRGRCAPVSARETVPSARLGCRILREQHHA